MMKPWLIYKQALSVVGVPLDGGELAQPYDALWDQLAARFAEIPHADPDTGYGIHSLLQEGPAYLAGLAVREIGFVPHGMAAKTIPAGLYAVFVHHGEAANLLDTVERVFSDWLPGSGYSLAGDFFFEFFDDRFDPGSDDSVVFVYLPVKETTA